MSVPTVSGAGSTDESDDLLSAWSKNNCSSWIRLVEQAVERDAWDETAFDGKNSSRTGTQLASDTLQLAILKGASLEFCKTALAPNPKTIAKTPSWKPAPFRYLLHAAIDRCVQSTQHERGDPKVSFAILELALEAAPEIVAHAGKVTLTRNLTHIIKETVLHYAARESNVEVVQSLHQACPCAVQKKNKGGQFPLEQAGSLDIFRFLYKVYPEAVWNRGADGSDLLETLVGTQKEEGVNEKLAHLLEQEPKANLLQRRYKDGGTLLHVAAKHFRIWHPPRTELVATKVPELCSVPDDKGCLPVHYFVECCNTRAPNVLPALISSTQQSEDETLDVSLLLVRNDKGDRAIDSYINVLVNSQGSKVRNRLYIGNWIMQSCPECLRDRHPQTGELPIHRVLRDKSKDATPFITAAPETLLVHNPDGLLPIHMAIQNKVATHQLSFMLEQTPGIAVDDSRDAVYGCSVLDWLLLNGYYSDEREFLDYHMRFLDNFIFDPLPTIAQVPDKHGRLALHNAMGGQDISTVLVSTLVSKYAKALTTSDANGWLPIEIACANNCSLDVIFTLLQSNPAEQIELLEKGHGTAPRCTAAIPAKAIFVAPNATAPVATPKADGTGQFAGRTIRTIVLELFRQQPIWDKRELVEAIAKGQGPPPLRLSNEIGYILDEVAFWHKTAGEHYLKWEVKEEFRDGPQRL